MLGKQVELRFEPQPCVHLPLPPCWEGLLPLSSTFYTGLHPETAGGAPDTLVDKEASVSSVSSPLLLLPPRWSSDWKGGERGRAANLHLPSVVKYGVPREETPIDIYHDQRRALQAVAYLCDGMF